MQLIVPMTTFMSLRPIGIYTVREGRTLISSRATLGIGISVNLIAQLFELCKPNIGCNRAGLMGETVFGEILTVGITGSY